MLQLQVVVLKDEHTGFVFVASAIVGRGEDGDHVRETVLSTPAMHLESFLLYLMSTEDTQKSVLAEELLHRFLTEVEGTVTLGILLEVTVNGFFVIHRIGPHQIAENAIKWDLLPPVDIVDLIKLFKVGGDSTVHRQVLFADVACDRH